MNNEQKQSPEMIDNADFFENIVISPLKKQYVREMEQNTIVERQLSKRGAPARQMKNVIEFPTRQIQTRTAPARRIAQ